MAATLATVRLLLLTPMLDRRLLQADTEAAMEAERLQLEVVEEQANGRQALLQAVFWHISNVS